MHHAERQRRVGSRPDHERLVGLRGRFRAAHVDRHDVGAAPPGGHHVARRVWLAREVCAPQHDQRRVRAHVLLGVGLEDAGEPQAEGAEAPADHSRVPPLTAVEVREATHQMRADTGAIVVGEESVPRPGADRRAPRRARALGDQIQRLVPRGAAQPVAASRAQQRHQQTARVADDLPRGLAADTQEAAAVRVVRVSADADEVPVLDLDQHPAQRGMAIHRAHRADCGGHDAHHTPRAAHGIVNRRSRRKAAIGSGIEAGTDQSIRGGRLTRLTKAG